MSWLLLIQIVVIIGSYHFCHLRTKFI